MKRKERLSVKIKYHDWKSAAYFCQLETNAYNIEIAKDKWYSLQEALLWESPHEDYRIVNRYLYLLGMTHHE